jgi:hypothetical protein
MTGRICFLILILSGMTGIYGQHIGGLKKVRVSTRSGPVRLDTLSILPGSLMIYEPSGTALSCIELDEIKAMISFSEKCSLTDSLTVYYKTLYINLSKEYFHKDFAKAEQGEKKFQDPFTIVYKRDDQDIFGLQGLNKSGSITRGITFGNNQDVVVNSNLNLQVSGRLSDKISISAAVADDNIPIQPEGNTQQLQEFDRVYIKVNDDRSTMIAGDFQLSRPNSHFMNYYKRAQGGWLRSGTDSLSKGKPIINGEVAAAVSRGKFSRNVFFGTEGNQGPYRLKGADNEAFIIVLSGTERIYIDGQLLIRGQENDYIIDYNTAEITFTARRLITKDKRIIAEFQYAERNYARSLLVGGISVKQKDWLFRTHIFSEQDNRNKPLSFTLDGRKREILRNAGDSANRAVVQLIDTVTYSDDLILYTSRDTLVNGILYENVFVYSTNPELAIYRPVFSVVGIGRGNYRQVNTTANGKVFEWIAPLDGILQGDYEPVAQLPTPTQKQMAVMAGEWTPNAQTKIIVEAAGTKNDRNTFSSIDATDDQGSGLRVIAENKTSVGKKGIAVVSDLQYEFVSRNFSPIERYRSVEFERDWNRLNADIKNRQHLLSVSAGLNKDKAGELRYRLNSFNEAENYNGIQHMLIGNYADSTWTLQGKSSYLQSRASEESSSFLRQRYTIKRRLFKKWQAGFWGDQDRSEIRETGNDDLIPRSFHFIEWAGFAGSADTTGNSAEVRYTQRYDWLSDGKNFKQATFGESYQISGAIRENPNHQFRSTVSYRKMSVQDSVISRQQPEETVLGRIEYGTRILKGAISTQTFYEIGTGQEVRKEYVFLEVAPGQGSYTWKDYNNNGVKELNEFEVSVFNDQARYIKVFTPTNQFVRTYNNQFSEVLNLSAPSYWAARGKKWQKFSARFNNQTAFRLERKTSDLPALEAFNPFIQPGNDSNLVSQNTALRNTVFFNRSNPVAGIDYTLQDNRNRNLLVNGNESRQLKSHTGKLRWNVKSGFLINGEYTQGARSSGSEFFSNRNYSINFREWESKLTWQPGVAFKLSVSYRNSNKSDITQDSLIRNLSDNIGIDIRYNEVSRGTFQAKFNMIQMRFNGDPNSPLGFEMLEGLLPGRNFVWNVTWQRTLVNNMQLNLSYDGRKSAEGRIIHTGGLQVRAFF